MIQQVQKQPADSAETRSENPGTGRDIAIGVYDVTVRFEDKYVLRNFSMHVRRGESVALTGESGRGKSTILRCLLGFVTPESGNIYIEGEKLTAETVWRLRRSMAYVPQEPDLGEGTLASWFRIPFSFKANAGLRDNLERLPEWMDRFALPETLLSKSVTELSGGEKQRAALIGAILLQRNILLLDEPTSALDRKNVRRVLDALFEIPDITLLAISHDPVFHERSHRVIELTETEEDHAD